MTGVQIAKFVRWASSAHSWYKHLPQQEAAVFSFVLDLSVAMKRTATGFAEQHEGEVSSGSPAPASRGVPESQSSPPSPPRTTGS